MRQGISARAFVAIALCVVLIISLVGTIFSSQVSAVRLKQRSLKVNSASIGRYSVTFNLPSSATIGSIRINRALSNLNLREATFVSQSGINDFQIVNEPSQSEFFMTRVPAQSGTQTNTFEFENITSGPTSSANFTLRMSTYANRGASGPAIHDFDVTAVRNTTSYEVSFAFPGTASVGGIRMEFCDDPVPDLDCSTVPGINVSNAVLASQSGNTGFAISQQNTNTIILSRSPSTTNTQLNTYVLDNVRNPSVASTFYIRLTSWSTSSPGLTDRSGYIDYGGVASASTNSIGLQTQVPPELIFCVGLQIEGYNCNDVRGGNFVDFGELKNDQTYSTQSQISTRTNAQDGYTVSVRGLGVTAGNKFVPSLEVPTMSAAGNSQFGINLVANSAPAIGEDQEGPGVVATISPNYAIPNQYMYKSGDTIINVNTSTTFKRYTVSYVLNVSKDQAPGLYGATITYISSGFF